MNSQETDYIAFDLPINDTLEREHCINSIHNEVLLWSLEQQCSVVIDELPTVLMVYFNRPSDVTLFALTWKSRVNDRWYKGKH
jgi:hypothetical protein